MISLPDELLERIDAYAEARRTSRSGLLRELAERELASGEARRRRRIEELLAMAAPHGGDNARWIREDRDRDNR